MFMLIHPSNTTQFKTYLRTEPLVYYFSTQEYIIAYKPKQQTKQFIKYEKRKHENKVTRTHNSVEPVDMTST